MSSVRSSPLVSSLAMRGSNLAASAAVVGFACAAYAIQPVHRPTLQYLYGNQAFSYTGWQFLLTAAAAYTLLLTIFYGLEAEPQPSKSLVCLRVGAAFVRAPRRLIRSGLSRDERLAVLGTLLKAYFAPIMVLSLMRFALGSFEHGLAIVSKASSFADFAELFNRHGYWLAMRLILFVDVLLFTVGYLVELPALKNEIRSVDPTVVGWAAALLCYPPFNSLTGFVLGSQVSDFPKFDDPMAHLAFNLLLLLLMAIYSSASVALGFKASNLTHRGIVSRGPYAVIRHPAYTCKNMAWWIGSIPLVAAAFSQSWVDGILAVGSVVGWTMLYVLRALTEEDHLRSVDGEYAVYASRVRYRFIPGLL